MGIFEKFSPVWVQNAKFELFRVSLVNYFITPKGRIRPCSRGRELAPGIARDGVTVNSWLNEAWKGPAAMSPFRRLPRQSQKTLEIHPKISSLPLSPSPRQRGARMEGGREAQTHPAHCCFCLLDVSRLRMGGSDPGLPSPTSAIFLFFFKQNKTKKQEKEIKAARFGFCLGFFVAVPSGWLKWSWVNQGKSLWVFLLGAHILF